MAKGIQAVIIIGAGIAGLAAARRLRENGVSVTVYDKGRGIGGRCATRRWNGATFDHGAQYFTVRDDSFKAVIDQAVADGAVVEWCQGFVKETGMPRDDGHPRYRGEPGMTAFPKWLAQGVNTHTGHPVTRVTREGGRITVTFESGESADADAVILTPPVPQSLALLEAGGIAMDGDANAALDAIEYAPCFAMLARLRETPRMPGPGGMHPRKGGPIAWIADNERKGIASGPCLTVHASSEFSQKHFDTGPEEVKAMLIEATTTALACDIIEADIHRWRYALPLTTAEEPCLTLSGEAPIVFAGDGFGGPRVEGAYLSGLAAAESLLSS